MPRKPDPTVLLKRQHDALSLRVNGASFRQIAAALGVSHEQARQDVQAALGDVQESMTEESKRQLQAIEWLRLEKPLMALRSLVDGSGPTKEIDLQAVEVWRKLSESRRKLRGLDAPSQVEVSGRDGEAMRLEMMRQKALENDDTCELVCELTERLARDDESSGNGTDGKPA